MHKQSIIFDLDGTLIDSASSILESLKAVFDEALIAPKTSFEKGLIGPPVPHIIAELLGDEHVHCVAELVERFKFHYDTLGYLNTEVYSGVEDALQSLCELNINLYIATNKRIAATRKILDHLGWTEFFKEVYALDYFDPLLSDKSTMLSRIVHDLKLDPSDLIYVGDRSEDAESAHKNSISFCWASWGYGDSIQNELAVSVLESPKDLLTNLMAAQIARNSH
jgi:phosphoglycolate phosphatase